VLLGDQSLDETERAASLSASRDAAARLAASLARLDRPEALGWVLLGPEELLDLRPGRREPG